ncbi:MAG: hypothetical protein R3199_02880 [Gemmatimonadota bacterium]|nr:hypothetical protein [Gemmatimonadota bacterium]
MDALLGEHAVLYAWFDAVEEAISSEAPGGDPLLVASPLLATLASHARIENELLFEPAVEELGEAAGPVTVMIDEHEEIEASAELAVGRREGVGERMLEVLARAREHFEKEERVAFAHAERALGEKRSRELGTEWAARRGVRLE